MASCQPKPPSSTSSVTQCSTSELDHETLPTTGETHLTLLTWYQVLGENGVTTVLTMSSSLFQSSGSHPGPGWLWEPAGSDGDLGRQEIQTGEEKQKQHKDVNTNHRQLLSETLWNKLYLYKEEAPELLSEPSGAILVPS